jgi:hypothetical protein
MVTGTPSPVVQLIFGLFGCPYGHITRAVHKPR